VFRIEHLPVIKNRITFSDTRKPDIRELNDPVNAVNGIDTSI